MFDKNKKLNRPSLVKAFKHLFQHKPKAPKFNAMHKAKQTQSTKHTKDKMIDNSPESVAKAISGDNPSTNFVKIETNALRRSLHFPANVMTPSNEVEDYAKMKIPAKKIMANDWTYFVAMIVMFFAIPLIARMFKIGNGIEDWIFGVVAAIAIWFINYYSVKTQYARYSFKNQLRFNRVLTVLDLSELKRGYSINALLSEVAARFTDKTLSDSIRTLNSRIQDKPESPMPYLEFANEFSTTQRARLFMLSVYRMAQGNYDDSEIKSIKHSASKDLTYQSTVLMHKKIRKFGKLWLMQFGGFVIFLIVYVLMFIVLDVIGALKEGGM